MKTRLKLPNPKKAKRFFSRKLAFTTGPVELGRWLKEGANVKAIDVRAAADYAHGHIPGALSLPKENWRKPTGLGKGKINVVYCYSQVCHLAAAAALEFAKKGFPVMELEGGFEAWKERGLPVRKARRVRRAAKELPAEEAAPGSPKESVPQASAPEAPASGEHQPAELRAA